MNNPSALQFSPAQDRPFKAGVPLKIAACIILAKLIGGAVKQVSTLTVDSASDANYTFKLRPLGGDAVTLVYSEGATGTTTTKATGIKNLINSHPEASSFCVATSSTNVVTITALRAGEGFTLSDSDAKLTSAVSTANASAGDLEFGAAAAFVSSDPTKVRAPDEANAVAKVVTVTPDNVTNSEVYSISVIGDFNRDGAEERHTLQYSDGSASAARLCNFFQRGFTESIASGMTTTDDGSVVTFTAAKGIDFGVEVSVAPAVGTDAAPTGGLTPAVSTAFTDAAFAGVVLAADRPETIDGAAKWRGTTRASVPILIQGIVPVRLDGDVASISVGDPVGYRVNDDGTDEINGAWRNAASGTDIYVLPKTRARWVDGQIYTDIDGHNVALLQLL